MKMSSGPNISSYGNILIRISRLTLRKRRTCVDKIALGELLQINISEFICDKIKDTLP